MTRHLTLPMLSLLVRLREQPGGWLPEHDVTLGTARALVHRGYCRWVTAQGSEARLSLTPTGRQHVDAALALQLPRWAA